MWSYPLNHVQQRTRLVNKTVRNIPHTDISWGKNDLLDAPTYEKTCLVTIKIMPQNRRRKLPQKMPTTTVHGCMDIR